MYCLRNGLRAGVGIYSFGLLLGRCLRMAPGTGGKGGGRRSILFWESPMPQPQGGWRMSRRGPRYGLPAVAAELPHFSLGRGAGCGIYVFQISIFKIPDPGGARLSRRGAYCKTMSGNTCTVWCGANSSQLLNSEISKSRKFPHCCDFHDMLEVRNSGIRNSENSALSQLFTVRRIPMGGWTVLTR